MEQVKPCPFCGAIPVLSIYPYTNIIACGNDSCFVQPRMGVEHEFGECDPSEAIKRWNKRDDEKKG